ncbi:hypothetical protein [Hydrogenophaga sp.]|uniref:hypothetical protein n=1 Tax=Hydrogenophaga sp. TaxID=1904254 RepID=UPI002721CC28|nr:hypothetical protein [Hydrogenophaga sp.]MDO9437623.1 hypothetical protein [Hydrogenophaga sp.]
MNQVPKKPTLEDRFTRFIEGLPNAENIDRLALPKDSSNTRKADFLLGNREVIVEMKHLTADPSHKVDATVEKHRDREDFPVFFGTVGVRKVLAHLSDGEDIYRRIVLSLTRSVEDGLRSAEKQIAHTKAVLNLPGSVGLLVVLNESIDILDPGLVGHRVAKHWRRLQQDGDGASQVAFVWLIFESHVLATVNGRPAVTSMLISGEAADRFPWFAAFHHDLSARWAACNNSPYVDGRSPDLRGLKFRSTSEFTKAAPTTMARHEIWRKQYRDRPYLRPLSDDELRAKAAEIIGRLMPMFLKGGPGFKPEQDKDVIVEWTHFLEEAEFRGLDFKTLQPYLKP